jgi:hypothetical protein
MVRRVRAFAVVATLILLSWTTPAHAAWYKAETDRFIVYGAASEATVRDYAAKLQTFDSILRMFHPSTAARAPAT